jgi:hypothetical protein
MDLNPEYESFVNVNYFPETDNLNWPTTQYEHIDHTRLRNSLIDKDKDYQTIINDGKRYKFIMQKKFIDKLSNKEIIIILKEIISGNDYSNICPCYISYSREETYHWLDNEFKNKFQNKLYFNTFHR